MTTRRPRMPDGIDREEDRAEARPMNGQRHEPWRETRSGNAGTDKAAGAGSAPCGGGPAPPAPDAGADTAPAEKRAGVAPAGGETWLYARYVAAKIAEHEGRMGPEQAALENRMLPLALQTAVEPAEEPGGGAAGMEAPPEPPRDEAREPREAAMSATAELKAVLLTFKADFVRWARNERRSRRRRAGLAMAVGFPACLLLGLLIQVQFEVIPPHDPASGWGKHIRDTYGRTIGNCEIEAMLTKSEVDCLLTVGRP